mgnify:CR=1 FL=1
MKAHLSTKNPLFQVPVVIALSSLLFVSCISSMLAPKLLKVALQPDYTSKDTAVAWKNEVRDYPYVGTWRDSLIKASALRDTFITAPDKTKLHALYIKSAQHSDITAIVIHGHTSSSVGVAHLGYMYNHDLGYNVMLPDLRLSGLSGGDHYTMGWYEREDVKLWIDMAVKLFSDTAKIIVHGVSMGAATTMMLSGDSLPQNVKWFVEDCGYTSVWEQFSYILAKDYHITGKSLLKAAQKRAQKKYNLDFKKASSINQIKKCRLPMLFIHGDADTYVPVKMVEQLYNAKPKPKEIWIVPGAPHALSYKTAAAEYTKRIKDFVSKYH